MQAARDNFNIHAESQMKVVLTNAAANGAFEGCLIKTE